MSKNPTQYGCVLQPLTYTMLSTIQLGMAGTTPAYAGLVSCYQPLTYTMSTYPKLTTTAYVNMELGTPTFIKSQVLT